ncbi:MAG TPA: D-aminoacyl-tRNA deacylase [Acidimicrobiia bacterium]|nr:D-aminoacyl-tRNA deacylase [Acidimicrobiia bacterium]
MRAVVQRVIRAQVEVEGRIVGEIGTGLVALVGVMASDGLADANALAQKLVDLRVFADDDGKMNRSVIDVAGAILVVSQFTLYGDVRRGRRPSFTEAAPPARAQPLIEAVVEATGSRGVRVERGAFGAHMQLAMTNDGPVTLIIEIENGRVS